jgi:hypothetical protein
MLARLFRKRFQKPGSIDYYGYIHVHSSLRSIVFHD